MDSAHCYGYHRKDSATSIRMRGYFRAGAVARARARFFFFFFRPRARAFSRRASLARRGGAPPEAAHLRLQYQGLSSTHASERPISYGWRSGPGVRRGLRFGARPRPARGKRNENRLPRIRAARRPRLQPKGTEGGAGLGSISGFAQTEPSPPGVDPASHPNPHTPSWRHITSPLRRPARNSELGRARARRNAAPRVFCCWCFWFFSFGQTNPQKARFFFGCCFWIFRSGKPTEKARARAAPLCAPVTVRACVRAWCRGAPPEGGGGRGGGARRRPRARGGRVRGRRPGDWAARERERERERGGEGAREAGAGGVGRKRGVRRRARDRCLQHAPVFPLLFFFFLGLGGGAWKRGGGSARARREVGALHGPVGARARPAGTCAGAQASGRSRRAARSSAIDRGAVAVDALPPSPPPFPSRARDKRVARANNNKKW